jgi:cation diffusion facilitator CzcD-associated flavoprotein CzcO
MNTESDVIVIGAGFAGRYATHKFRDELGLTVRGFDAAGGPGGTWWWNRYPGARCDIESVHYSYSVSEQIQRGWQWSERFAAQPEILAYLEYVADTLDVRREFTFNTRVSATVWDEQTQRWTVTTDDGHRCTARFVIAASGNLSVPTPPEFPRLHSFTGEVHATSSWPHDEVEFAGKRVGVIGTGSTGIQLISTVGRQAGHLTVFQRTPNYTTPLGNAPVEPSRRRWLAEHHAELRADVRQHTFGVPFEPAEPATSPSAPSSAGPATTGSGPRAGSPWRSPATPTSWSTTTRTTRWPTMSGTGSGIG